MVIKQKVYGDDYISTADTLNNIASVNQQQGNYKEALDNYSKALVIYQKFHNKTHPSIKLVLENINIVKFTFIFN